MFINFKKGSKKQSSNEMLRHLSPKPCCNRLIINLILKSSSFCKIRSPIGIPEHEKGAASHKLMMAACTLPNIFQSFINTKSRQNSSHRI